MSYQVIASLFLLGLAVVCRSQPMYTGATAAQANHAPAPGAPLPPYALNQAKFSNCDFLKNVKSRVPTNAGAFKIYTRSRKARITRGTPVEVTIGPFSPHLSMFNFTSFIMFAEPFNRGAPDMMTGAGAGKHLGVFQLFDRWSAGAGGLTCSPSSGTDDSVGAFEDLILPRNYPRPARNQVAVLWWPTKEALAFPEIRFKANIQSGGHWYKLQSTPWRVNRPVDQMAQRKKIWAKKRAQMQQRRDRMLEHRSGGFDRVSEMNSRMMEQMTNFQEHQQTWAEQARNMERAMEGKSV